MPCCECDFVDPLAQHMDQLEQEWYELNMCRYCDTDSDDMELCTCGKHSEYYLRWNKANYNNSI